MWMTFEQSIQGDELKAEIDLHDFYGKIVWRE